MNIDNFQLKQRFLRRGKVSNLSIERCNCCTKPCTYRGEYIHEKDRFRIEFYPHDNIYICLLCWERISPP